MANPQATVRIWAGQLWHTRLMQSCCCRSWGNKQRRTLRGASASPPGPPSLAPAGQGTLSAPASVLCLEEAAADAQAQAGATSQPPSRVEAAAGQQAVVWSFGNVMPAEYQLVLSSHHQLAPADTVGKGSATLSIAASLAAIPPFLTLQHIDTCWQHTARLTTSTA